MPLTNAQSQDLYHNRTKSFKEKARQVIDDYNLACDKWNSSRSIFKYFRKPNITEYQNRILVLAVYEIEKNPVTYHKVEIANQLKKHAENDGEMRHIPDFMNVGAPTTWFSNRAVYDYLINPRRSNTDENPNYSSTSYTSVDTTKNFHQFLKETDTLIEDSFNAPSNESTFTSSFFRAIGLDKDEVKLWRMQRELKSTIKNTTDLQILVTKLDKDYHAAPWYKRWFTSHNKDLRLKLYLAAQLLLNSAKKEEDVESIVKIVENAALMHDGYPPVSDRAQQRNNFATFNPTNAVLYYNSKTSQEMIDTYSWAFSAAKTLIIKQYQPSRDDDNSDSNDESERPDEKIRSTRTLSVDSDTLFRVPGTNQYKTKSQGGVPPEKSSSIKTKVKTRERDFDKRNTSDSDGGEENELFLVPGGNRFAVRSQGGVPSKTSNSRRAEARYTNFRHTQTTSESGNNSRTSSGSSKARTRSNLVEKDKSTDGRKKTGFLLSQLLTNPFNTSPTDERDLPVEGSSSDTHDAYTAFRPTRAYPYSSRGADEPVVTYDAYTGSLFQALLQPLPLPLPVNRTTRAHPYSQSTTQTSGSEHAEGEEDNAVESDPFLDLFTNTFTPMSGMKARPAVNLVFTFDGLDPSNMYRDGTGSSSSFGDTDENGVRIGAGRVSRLADVANVDTLILTANEEGSDEEEIAPPSISQRGSRTELRAASDVVEEESDDDTTTFAVGGKDMFGVM